MERIILKHLSGSKANQVEEFPLKHFKELTIGRDPSSAVKYDPELDDLVGRQHAKITLDPADPKQFIITDLNSRNGTYVNRQRILGTARIVPGDVIQLGPGGPEFQFDVEPRPKDVLRPTRVADSGLATAVGSPRPTRVAHNGDALTTQPSAVGRSTVMRLIEQARGESRKYVMLGGGALLIIIALVAAVIVYKAWRDERARQQQGQQTQEELARLRGGLAKVEERTSAMTPAEIASAYSDAVVFIQVSWQLIEAEKGLPLFFRFIPNRYIGRDGAQRPIVADGRPFVMCFTPVQSPGGSIIEPFLTTETDSKYGVHVAVGFSLSGSGFCITNDGFIITNRHVAYPWKAPYQGYVWSKYAFPGVLVDRAGRILLGADGNPQLVTQPFSWVPEDTRQFGEGQLGQYPVIGRNDALFVTFPKTERRIPAEGKGWSDRHDVAMMRVDLPGPVPTVELYDNYDTIRPGDETVVLGYPGGSPPEVVLVQSKAPIGGAPLITTGIIPNPTLSVGYISRVLRHQVEPGKDPVLSSLGDVYQLTINTTGGGNSGGPVFDKYGRVIAVYTYGIFGGDFQASGAVPIRYAKELMGIQKVR